MKFSFLKKFLNDKKFNCLKNYEFILKNINKNYLIKA